MYQKSIFFGGSLLYKLVNHLNLMTTISSNPRL